jgi:hypothetical protein
MTNNRCDFFNLRHLEIEVLVDGNPGCSSGILRLASLLELTPSLEVFNLHVSYCLLSFLLHDFCCVCFLLDPLGTYHSTYLELLILDRFVPENQWHLLRL